MHIKQCTLRTSHRRCAVDGYESWRPQQHLYQRASVVQAVHVDEQVKGPPMEKCSGHQAPPLPLGNSSGVGPDIRQQSFGDDLPYKHNHIGEDQATCQRLELVDPLILMGVCFWHMQKESRPKSARKFVAKLELGEREKCA